MSTLETNSIGKYSGNNVSIDDSLNLKSYTTTQRDALTSVAGDTIYNSTTNKPQYYDGSNWQDMVAPLDVAITYLAVGGGGGSGSTTVVNVTVSVLSYNGYDFSSLGVNTHFGNYSFGKIETAGRTSTSPFNSYLNNGLTGLSTSAQLRRTLPLKISNYG